MTESVRGKTTDRILSGEIPADSINPPRSLDPPAKAESVRHGSGKSLSKGSDRKKGSGK